METSLCVSGDAAAAAAAASTRMHACVCVCVCVSLLKCSKSIASTQRDKSWQTKGIVGFRDYFQLSYLGWSGATPQKHSN